MTDSDRERQRGTARQTDRQTDGDKNRRAEIDMLPSSACFLVCLSVENCPNYRLCLVSHAEVSFISLHNRKTPPPPSTYPFPFFEQKVQEGRKSSNTSGLCVNSSTLLTLLLLCISPKTHLPHSFTLRFWLQRERGKRGGREKKRERERGGGERER